MNVNSKLAGLIVVLAAISFFSQLSKAAENGSNIAGVVKNASGNPVAGASITAKNIERGFAVTVISQNGGHYDTSSLPSGKYTVRGVGGGLQSDEISIELDGKKSGTVNLALTGPSDFKQTASMSDFASIMPESEAKGLIISLCTDCHKNGLQEIFLTHKNREGWTESIAKMRSHPYGFYRSLDISEQQQGLVLDYLAQHFGPEGTPVNLDDLPKAWITGAAAKAIFTELKLPEGTNPHDVDVDSSGIGWVSESGPGNIGRYDPRTFAYTRIPLPGQKSSSTAIAIDSQDRVWVADTPNMRLVMYDPTSETFISYPLPKPPAGNTNIVAIRFSSDGAVWATEIAANQLVRLDPATKEVRIYRPPAGVIANANVNPAGIAIDGNKTLWFTEEKSDKIAEVDPKTGEITEYDVPTRGAVPRRMAADATGNLWFGEFAGMGKLGMLDYRSKKFAEFSTPTKYSGAYAVAADTVHNLIWVNEMMADQIAKFDPRTHAFVEYAIPSRNSLVRRIEVDPSRPNRVWFAGSNVDTIGYLDVIE
jgi:virginiamycin B lyase